MWPLNIHAQTELEGLTFKEALQACIEAVGSGDLQSAASLFHLLEVTFGAEDEYLTEEVQRRILPLKGLAELGAGQFQQAADTLDSLEESYPQALQQNAALLYGWARAHKGAGNNSKAREALDRYMVQVGGKLEAFLAQLERADLFFADGMLEEGLTEIDGFSNSHAPDSLKMQGHLKAVQAHLNEGQLDQATARILNNAWSVSTMPELAQLAFSALRCGEHSMAAGRYRTALKLFHLVPPKSQLVRLQQEKLDDLKLRILSGRRRALLATNRHQQQYLGRLQQQLTQQLDALARSEDYTPSFYLRYGQCLLFDDQLYKAWLMFEYISLNEGYETSIREEAHYRWVICAHQLQDWEEALTIARNFVERYPDSKLAPQALYLIAKAHLEQRRYPESIEVLDDLIKTFVDHPLHGRWLFTRGFNQVVLEDYDAARTDFARYATEHPQGQLVINSKLWNALTYFFEREYTTCIDQLSELRSLDPRHPLFPEILYRLASSYYSARDFDPALETIGDYLKNFVRHQRVDEAHVLRGDILMGQGRLEEATVSFDSVSWESPDMYLYSLFQRGKIFRAQEDYPEMVQLFESFLEGDESPKIRVSEALYWLGWAYQQDGKTAQAYPVFEEALTRYGNDTQAAETQSILQALEKIKRKEDPDGFESWLTEETKRAQEEGLLTYLSRLVVYQNSRLSNPEEKETALLKLADLIPLDQLDPEALGQVGLTLIRHDSARAEPFLSYLIEHYPKSNARAMGYLGLARLANQEAHFEGALSLLQQAEVTVPVHPHMNEVKLLLGNVLSQLHEYNSSIETFENLLRLKSARGRPHAQALAGIAQAQVGLGNLEKASAYYQRIYNMYRAYPDLVAQAYLQGAQLFEAMDRIPDTVSTLEEMLTQKKLESYPEWELAEKKLKQLLPLMPEEANETPDLNDETED